MNSNTVFSSNLLFTKLRKLTSLNNQLKEAGLQQSIEPLRIIVIGTQSVGKSSVLESILGFDLLPKGLGPSFTSSFHDFSQAFITRRPIELNLVHLSSNQGENPKAYVEFPKEGNEKYFDFQEAADKISCLMERERERNNVSDDPIIIKVYSPDCPDLTLVDLPGIPRLPQYDMGNVERKTKAMSRKYANNPKTIILCVISAMQDICTSDALQLALQEDPEGIRLLGVITKMDLIDKGTDIKSLFLNPEVPLKFGYIGLKGRSQQDLQNGMRISEALKAENEFFTSHLVYSTLPSDLLGTEALLQKLSEVIFAHIRRTVSEICREIRDKTTEYEEKLKNLDLCKDLDQQIVAEKQSLGKTLEVLKSVKYTLNNDLDLAPNPQDDILFKKLEKIEKSQRKELGEWKPKGKSLFCNGSKPLDPKNNLFG